MTAAEILRSAEPPSDDGLIDKAIAELDVKIWEWTDALKSAQSQLRSAFAVRPAPRASAPLFDDAAVAPSLSAAAAAAHLPTAAPMPKQWAERPAPSEIPAWSPPQGPPAALGGQTGAFPPPPAPQAETWPQRPAQQHGGHGASSNQSNQQQPDNGAMQWPSATSATGTMQWPDSNPSGTGAQQWPTWNPTDSSQGGGSKKSGVRATKAPKAVRQPLPQGPTPEERAQKAAAEEALLSELEDAIARRVRLLRRLDPDTPIEKLIEKARQGHAEAPQAASPPRDDRSGSSSSWWRRK